MPTGYTQQLKEMNFDTKKWLKEGIIRATGVCVMLRDDGDKTSDEILEHLEKEMLHSYHAKHLAVLQKEHDMLSNMEPSLIEDLTERYNKEATESYLRYKKEKESLREVYTKTLEELQVLHKAFLKTGEHNEVTKNTLEFAIAQVVDSIKWDCNPEYDAAAPVPLTKLDYLVKKITACNDSIKYHEKELVLEDKRNKERYEFYKKYVEFVDSVKL